MERLALRCSHVAFFLRVEYETLVQHAVMLKVRAIGKLNHLPTNFVAHDPIPLRARNRAEPFGSRAHCSGNRLCGPVAVSRRSERTVDDM